jgi:SepF-like predicted cell division protein (DUF552 family)
MVLKELKKSLATGRASAGGDKEEYVEVDVGGSGPGAARGKIGIRIESIAEFGDTEKVLKFMREGDIVMLKIKSLREKDLSELKRAVERLKRTILAQNGDLVGVEQDWLLVVPQHVTVHR